MLKENVIKISLQKKNVNIVWIDYIISEIVLK